MAKGTFQAKTAKKNQANSLTIVELHAIVKLRESEGIIQAVTLLVS